MSRLEHAINAAVAGVVVSFLVAAVVAPPDPFTQLAVTAILLAVTVPASYLALSRGVVERITG